MKGIDRLRVCDSSIMPLEISANTNAPTIMIAEKASDLILAAAASTPASARAQADEGLRLPRPNAVSSGGVAQPSAAADSR